MQKDLVTAAIKAVIPAVDSCAVFLGNAEKTFVIYVDTPVGKAIEMALHRVKRERPLTHDLIGRIFLGLGVRLDHVVICDQVVNPSGASTFYARVLLRMENELGKKIVEIDARPSDSIVLALQQERPIYVSRAVFDKVADDTEILERELKQQADSDGPGDEDEPA